MVDKKWQRVLDDYDRHCQHIAKATMIALGEKPAEKTKRIKKLEADYIAWFEYYFPHYAKVKCAWYHKKLAKLITKNKKSKTLAEIFRSGAKSVHICMGVPLYLYYTHDLFFMLLVGETDPKAKQLLGDIQAELQFNQRLINDYGRKFKQGDWADGNFYTSDGVRFLSIGFGMSPRGLREGAKRPDYIVVDDVDTKKHVNNDKIMGDSVDYILEEVLGCFDAADDANERFVYSNNNFHKNSITNRLKKEFNHFIQKDKEAGEKSDYNVLTVTAVKDLVNFEPNWPEKTTSAYWRKKYEKRPRSFLREYQHVHVSEGKIFLAKYMQWKKMLALSLYDALVMYGDLSYKAQGDYKAMALVGKIGRERHIIHSFLRQVSRRSAAKWLYELYEDRKLDRFNITYKIEGLFAQDEFVNDFDEEGDERGYHIPVVADKRSKEGKFDRIESTAGYFERGNMWWNEDERTSTDQVEAVDQYLAFEKGSQAHDDFPDAVHGGLDEVNRKSHVDNYDNYRFSKRTHSSKHSY